MCTLETCPEQIGVLYVVIMLSRSQLHRVVRFESTLATSTNTVLDLLLFLSQTRNSPNTSFLNRTIAGAHKSVVLLVAYQLLLSVCPLLKPWSTQGLFLLTIHNNWNNLYLYFIPSVLIHKQTSKIMALVGDCGSFKVKIYVKPDNSWPTVLIYCLTRFTIGAT